MLLIWGSSSWDIPWYLLNANCFVDDTSLFSAVNDIDTSENDLNHDLEKMGFSVENEVWPRSHQTGSSNNIQQEKTVSLHPVVNFNYTPVNSTATHKHLGMILDSKLSYENHLQSVFSRVNKTIYLFEKISTYSSEKIYSDNL